MLIAGRVNNAINRDPFFQTPTFPVSMQNMANAIRSRIHKISARDHFLDLVHAKNVFLWQTNYTVLTHRKPRITVTQFISHRINYCNPKFTVTALIVG